MGALLYHRLANGRWQKFDRDPEIWNLANVPGTTTLWATGMSGKSITPTGFRTH